MANRQGTKLEDEESLFIYNKIIEESKLDVIVMDYDLSWIKETAEYYIKNK